jgi:hypothetical protein
MTTTATDSEKNAVYYDTSNMLTMTWGRKKRERLLEGSGNARIAAQALISDTAA